MNFVGSRPVFIKGFIKAIVEELRVFQRRVQENTEASIGWVPRGFHGNADGVFVTCFFDGGYLFPGSPIVYSVVIAAVVFAAQDFPGGAQCLNVDRGSIVERGFWVELDADGLCTIRGFGFELGNVVGVGSEVSGVVAYPSSGGGRRVHGRVNSEH